MIGAGKENIQIITLFYTEYAGLEITADSAVALRA